MKYLNPITFFGYPIVPDEDLRAIPKNIIKRYELALECYGDYLTDEGKITIKQWIKDEERTQNILPW